MSYQHIYEELRSEELVGATDFYQLLGVETEATPEEINEAFRELVQASPEKFDDLEKVAYQAIYAKAILCTDKKRRIYDVVGHDTYFTLIGSGESLEYLVEQVEQKVETTENPTIAVHSMGPRE